MGLAAPESTRRIACIASGLGHVRRGLETWMAELSGRLEPSHGFIAEPWGGAAMASGNGLGYRIPLIRRDSAILRRIPWHYRYHLEQLTAVLPAALALRRRRVDIALCVDPSLAWNLKRFRRWHRAKVIFSDGIRLSPRWLQDYDGIHLLAPVYLEEARAAVRPERFERFFAVPYFVDLDQFRKPTPDQRRAARERLGLKPDQRVALSIGPVGSESSKRLDHLARELAATGDPRWVLLSVGADEPGADAVRGTCTAALGERVRFLGSRPREELPAVFHAADLYALGALAEPFSIAILEALASGLPVVHHRFPVTQWITGEAGLAADMERPGAAAEILNRFAGDGNLRVSCGEAALKLASERYAPEVVAGQLASHFARILALPDSGRPVPPVP